MFWRKKRIEEKETNEKNNPTKIFATLGGTFEKLWHDMVKGENEAVNIYNEYLLFKQKLLKKCSPIDYDRIILSNKTYDISFGQLMYLEMINAREIFLSDNKIILLNEDSQDTCPLLYDDYLCAYKQLKENETNFIKETKKFLNEHITNIVEQTSKDIWGYNKCKSCVPVNTIQCQTYHKELSEQTEEKLKKEWCRIYRAPIFRRISESDPLILINFKYDSIFIIDYLCFAKVSHPTQSLEMMLSYKDMRTNKTMKEVLCTKFGNNIINYIEEIIKDLNGKAFREFVRNGLKIE